MLGMNADDAMGLAEDMAVLQGAVRRQPPMEPVKSSSGAAAAIVAAVGMKVVKVQNDANAKLRSQFDGLSADYSDLSAVSLASRKVIDALVTEIAQARGLQPAEVKASVYKSLSREYDRQIGDMLSIGVLNKDPRRDPAVRSRPSRDWYTPEA